MNDQNTTDQPDADDFKVLYVGTCPSLSGQSEITYEVGTIAGDESGGLHLRLTKNTGKGMFCKDPVPVSDIDAILATGKELTAKAFLSMWPGRSTNNAGFALAVVRNLGVVKRLSEEHRHHSGVPGATAQQAIAARISEGKSTARSKKRTADGGE